ncbi:hypothetical protein QFC24_001218 [Naganishia onofrii]|uniref:Uncharacterized protein n=1 Tax=Naganishia onofrii TaxID=1851511 RepID=A0ACC2XUR7_9TREE|nr:hypothetical protein QFC24_001218 [Naganishia onofrii]
MSTQTQHPFEDGSLEDKKHQLGEAPVNELSKEADAPSDRDDALSFEQQQGVTRIEALYHVFGKGWKYWGLWVAIMLVFYAYSLSSNTSYIYQPFATSGFEQHAVIGTIGVVTNLISGTAKPFIGKIADLTSRPMAILFAVTFYTIGAIIIAASRTVGAVCVGMVIFASGATGIDFLFGLVIADITSIQWRGFVNGVASLPFIVNAFVASDISSAISLENWRWGYGMFAIILPACILPVLSILFWADWKAKKLGALSPVSSDIAHRRQQGSDEPRKPFVRAAMEYLDNMDAFGLLLLTFAWCLMLLPFTLSASADNGYKNPSMIAMFVVGGVLFIFFCVWEWKFANYPLQSKHVLNRSFLCSVVIDFMYYLSGYISDTYFTSWIYVVTDWSDKNYGYYVNILTVGLCFFGTMAGLVQRYTHRYKYLQVSGLCFRILGVGLTFYATQGYTTDAVLISARVITSLGGAISVIGSQTATQASVPHQYLATASALLAMYTSIGGSIGSAIASALWTHRLPANLEKYVGDVYNSTEIAEIYGSIVVARTAEPRDLIKKDCSTPTAYNDTAYDMFLPALILCFVPLIAGFLTSNFYLDDSHNAIETNKKIVLRTEEEIKAEEEALKNARMRETADYQ